MKNLFWGLAAACLTQIAHAHGNTVHFYLDDQGVPTTGDEATDGTISPLRGFDTDWSTWDPTCNAFGTSFPGWSWGPEWLSTDKVHFDVLTGVEKWNGAGFDPTSLTANIVLGSQSITTGGSFVSGFDQLLGPEDHFHYHYNLNGVPQDDTAHHGIYRLAFQATRLSGESKVSYPSFSITFNLNDDPDQADAAADFANDHPVAPATLSGTISISGWNGTARTVLIETIDPASKIVLDSVTTTLASDGSFSVPAPNRLVDDFRISVVGTATDPNRWLTKRLHGINVSSGSAAIHASLQPGDADGNNIVNIVDYSILSDHFNTSAPDTHFDPRADFDGNGAININDYALLSDNFNAVGDQ